MHFEQTIDIDARPEDVWAVLSDVKRWGEWTPTVKSFEWVEGDILAEGAKARLELEGAPRAVWTVREVDEGQSFSWESNVRGVRTVGGHVIEPREAGSHVVLSLDYSGFMATLFRPMIARVSRRNMAMEADGLKRASEARSATVV